MPNPPAINPISVVTPTPAVRPLAPLGGEAGGHVPNWQTGQMLNATVKAILSANQAMLSIDGVEVHAETPPGLSLGQSLRLRVLDSDAPLPSLRILPRADDNTATPAALLRESLPRQLAWRDTLGQLTDLLNNASGPAEKPFATQIQRLLDALPGMAQLATPVGAREAILASGGFLEALLPRHAVSPRDLKLRLLMLAEQASSPTRAEAADSATPTAIMKAVEAALAGIETRQAQVLQQQPDSPLLRVDIPLLAADGRFENIRLDVHRDTPSGDAEAEPIWRLLVHFDMRATGPLDVSLSIQGETASASLWSERATTHARVERHLPLLEAGLRQAGFEIGTLIASAGRPPRRTGENHADPEHNLLDIRI